MTDDSSTRDTMDKLDYLELLRSKPPLPEEKRAVATTWRGISRERPKAAFGAMTPKMAHIYNRRILIERFPLKGEEVRRRRPRTAPKQHVVKYSPLHEYVKSRHPIDIFDGSRTAASNLGLAKVNERTSPSWSLGVRLKDPKSREVRPGPCQYDVADALDKRSQAHGNPRFTMGVKTPGYLDRPPQSSSGANIGIAPLRWDDSGKKGFSLGIRHRHLDFKPADLGPGPAGYDVRVGIAPEGEKRDKVRRHHAKYPNMGMRLKSRRSIDKAIGLPEPPGPGQYPAPSSIGTRSTSFGVRHKHLDPKYNDSPGVGAHDTVGSYMATQVKRTPAYSFANKPYVSSNEDEA